MDRNLDIGYGFNPKKSNDNLSKTLELLKGIRESVVAINAEKINIGQVSLSKAEQSMKRVTTQLKQIAINTNKTNKSLTELRTRLNSLNTTVDTSNEKIVKFAGSLMLFNTIKRIMPSFLSFEGSVYNLGVVSKLTVPEIEKLKQTMLGLGADFPQSATEIANATNTIVRTGQDLDSAMQVVRNAMRLAIADGEDLASAVQIVNKILVAMKIPAKDSADSLDVLHGVAVNTATDLAKVGEASKYWSSALATVSNVSNKSGEELEEYRQELFKFGAVATGVFANLGRDSTMGGTGIRTLTNKLIHMEKTAMEMFKADLMNKAVYIDPKTFDIVEKGVDSVRFKVEDLNKYALQNFPQTVNLLSQLVNKDIVKLPTLFKMFTGRQGGAISAFLQEINGDMDEYSENILKQSNLSEDYTKKLSDLNSQLGIFQGKLKKTGGIMGGEFKNILEGTLAILNKFFDAIDQGDGKTNSFAEFFKTLLGGIATGVTAMTSFVAVTRLLSLALGGASLASVFLNPITLGVTAIATVMGLIIKHKKKLEEITAQQKKSLDLYLNSEKELVKLNNQLDFTEKKLREIQNTKIDDNWLELTNSLKEYRQQLEGLPDLEKTMAGDGETLDFDLFKAKLTGMYKDLNAVIEKNKRNRKP